MFSCVQLFATPWTVACQAPLFMGFSKQGYRSGLLFPTLGDLPDPEIKPASPVSPALAGRFFYHCVPPVILQQMRVPEDLNFWDFTKWISQHRILKKKKFYPSPTCKKSSFMLKYSVTCFPNGSAVKNPPGLQEMQKSRVQSLGQEYPLEEEMAIHSSTCLGNPMDRGPQWTTVQGGHKEWNTTEWLSMHTCTQ